MIRNLTFLATMLAMGVVSAQGVPGTADDPVMQARMHRAEAQGISEGDLPPMPRAVLEPPPLPPPETHVKDLRGHGRHGGAVKVRGRRQKGKAHGGSRPTARPGRKSRRAR